jgi:DNA-binding HxlR family transcriptional regulator/putative sterol carrier protein
MIYGLLYEIQVVKGRYKVETGLTIQGAVPGRSYDQYCVVARALDVIGERWTLLVVRELLIGPKRFTDLLEGLPGIATNLLSARLKHMETGGLIRRRRLPPPAASTVYELTELGRGLEPVLGSLARWSMPLIKEPPAPDEFLRPGWFLLGMRLTFNREGARGVHETYEFRLGEEVFHAVVDDGRMDLQPGHAEHPDLVVTTDPKTFVEIGFGFLDPAQAVSDGLTHVEGDPDAAQHALEIFATPTRTAPPGAAPAQPTSRTERPAQARTRTPARRGSADRR